MLIKCYVKGAVVGINGGVMDANPFTQGTEAHADWLVGYRAGGIAAKRMLALAVGKATKISEARDRAAFEFQSESCDTSNWKIL